MSEQQENFQLALDNKIENLKTKWIQRKQFIKEIVEPAFSEISQFFNSKHNIQLTTYNSKPNYQNIFLALNTLGRVNTENTKDPNNDDYLKENLFLIPFVYKLEITYISNQGEIRPKIVTYFAENENVIDNQTDESKDVTTNTFTSKVDQSLSLSSSHRFSNFHEVTKEEIINDFMNAFYEYQEKNL